MAVFHFWSEIPHLYSIRFAPVKFHGEIPNICTKKAICLLGKNHVSSWKRAKSSECSLGGVTRCPLGGLVTSMMGARCVPPCPSNKRRMLFIALVLPICCVACYVLACCHVMPRCLLYALLIVGLSCCYPLVGYACFVLARCNIVAHMRGDACGVANQWVCSCRHAF